MNGVLLITGGTRGIGAAVSRMAAKLGYDICATYLSDEKAAADLADEVRSGGRGCSLVQGDVADPSFSERALRAASELGKIAGLVNNAGITGPISRLQDCPPETIAKVVSINLLGTLYMSQAVLNHWERNGETGTIINLSSVAARLGAPNEYVAYAASKAGIEAMTVGLAKEVAAKGIRICAVAPGTVYTDIHAAAGEPGRPERVVGRVPMQRIAEPEEIANAVLWLLSKEASFVTGTVLTASGGL